MYKALLKSQKKQIFDLLVRTGLAPSDFEWHEMRIGYSSGPTALFRHKSAGHFFKFDLVDHKYACTYTPGFERPFGEHVFEAWDDVFGHVRAWLAALKKEIGTIDPWERIDEYLPKDDTCVAREKKNTCFTPEEVGYIEESLRKLEYRINEIYAPDAARRAEIRSRIEYLCEKAKRLGRIDWKNILVGTIIHTMLDLAMDPGKTAVLWRIVKECFSGALCAPN